MDKVKIAELEIDYQEVLKSLVDLKKGIDDTKMSTADLIDQNKQLEKAGLSGSEQHQRNAKAIEQNNIVLAGLTKEYRDNQKVLVTNVNTNKDSIGTIERLESRNRELRQAVRGLNLETEDGKKKAREYNNEINANTESIRKNTDAYTKQKMNIGNYDGALKDMAVSLGMVTSIMGDATLAVTKLKDEFANTEAGKKFFTRLKEASSAFFANLLQGNAGGAGAAALAAFTAAKQMDDVRVKERDDLKQEAILQRDLNLLQLEAADTTKSFTEQTEALNRARAKEDELIKFQIDNKKEELAATELLLAQNINNTALLDKRAQLDADIIALEGSASLKLTKRAGEANQKLLEQQNNYFEAAKAMIAAEAEAKDEQLKHEVEAEKQANDAILQEKADAAAKGQQFDEEQRAFKLNRDIEAAEQDRQRLEAQMTDEFSIRESQLKADRDAEVNNAIAKGQKVKPILDKYAQYEINLEKQKRDAKMAVIGGFANSMAQLFGENTKVGRAAAVVSATIDTYRGAVAAFAQTPGGVVIKSLAAATAVASGIASVKKIIATKSGLPGDSSSGSAPDASVASVPGTAASSVFADPTSAEAVNLVNQSKMQTVLVLEDFQKVEQNAIAVKSSAAL